MNDDLTPRETEVLDELRFQRMVEHAHRLGPRPYGELLSRVALRCSVMSVIEEELENLSRLDPDMVKALGGDQYPPLPIHIISKAEGHE